MGAAWVIFPFGQNSGFYWSPNAAIEKYSPGRCANRDLVMEIAVALKRENISIIAYLPTEMDGQSEEMRRAYSWDESADKKEFMRKYSEVLREYGEKFGGLIAGWWFDGCYNAKDKAFLRTRDWDNTGFDKGNGITTVKAGYKERILPCARVQTKWDMSLKKRNISQVRLLDWNGILLTWSCLESNGIVCFGSIALWDPLQWEK